MSKVVFSVADSKGFEYVIANATVMEHHVTSVYISGAFSLRCLIEVNSIPATKPSHSSADSGAEFRMIIAVCRLEGSDSSRHGVLINKCFLFFIFFFIYFHFYSQST